LLAGLLQKQSPWLRGVLLETVLTSVGPEIHELYKKTIKSKEKKECFLDFSANQIFCLLITVLKVCPQHSLSAIVSSILFPALSGLPAIFQVFLGATSFPHLGHFAINSPPYV